MKTFNTRLRQPNRTNPVRKSNRKSHALLRMPTISDRRGRNWMLIAAAAKKNQPISY